MLHGVPERGSCFTMYSTNDIIISRPVEKGEVTALTLLDLSAAFDTTDIAIFTNTPSARLVWNIWKGSNLVVFLFEK